MLPLNELDEIRQEAYENSRLYKEKTKRWHNTNTRKKEFNCGRQVLLFNSRHKLFPIKLKSRWSGPFTVTKVYPYGVVELNGAQGNKFKLNDQRLKKYFGGKDDVLHHVAYLHDFIK